MKKIFTLALAALSFGAIAQSSLTASLIVQGNRGPAIANGSQQSFVTEPDGDPIVLTITFKNNSASTYTYNMKRTIIAQNPPLSMVDANKPKAYFCFGQLCNPPGTSVNEPSNYVTLNAGEDSFGNSNVTSIDLEEGATQGYYAIVYKIYNVDPAKANDTLSFTAYYNNATVGIKKLYAASETISNIYPNPSTGASKIYVDLVKDDELKFQVYNSLGSIVYSSSKQKYTAGKNQLAIDAELTSGVYFVTLSNGTSVTTKRLVIAK